MNPLKIRLFRNVGAMAFDLYVHRVGDTGERQIARVHFEPVEANTYQPPTVQMDEGQGQQLIDDLWSAGFRPTEGAGSAGALAATQRHLEDMRTIAFAALKPTLLIEDTKGPTR